MGALCYRHYKREAELASMTWLVKYEDLKFGKEGDLKRTDSRQSLFKVGLVLGLPKFPDRWRCVLPASKLFVFLIESCRYFSEFSAEKGFWQQTALREKISRTSFSLKELNEYGAEFSVHC